MINNSDSTKKIRNFCIIAHIDHGKSTLADRILEITGTVEKRKMKERVLDTLDLEQERGITIKLQTVRMNYNGFILNLIDTPGHVDFSYEVSRALAACEGAIILIDATQGVQAQTLSTFYAALEHNLEMIPVINKIDLPNSETERVKAEIISVFGFREEDIIYTSGKTGAGVKELLDEIIKKVPAPIKSEASISRALIFDSFYHEHKGAVALIRVFDGKFSQNDKFYFNATNTAIRPLEIGYLKPQMTPEKFLYQGEVGYIATGLKDLKTVSTGDTVFVSGEHTNSSTPLEGYRKPKPMVYAGLYPSDSNNGDDFRSAIEQLAMNDSAFTFKPENSLALGYGYRCGFLGLLHLEIIQERLSREFNIGIIVTSPSVEYALPNDKDLSKAKLDEKYELDQLTIEKFNFISSALDISDNSKLEYIYEPIARVEILTPDTYIGSIMELCQNKRGIYITSEYLITNSKINFENKYILIKYDIPLNEIITDFFDKLKSVSSGYASLDYQVAYYKRGEIVRLDFLVNHEIIEPLSLLINEETARRSALPILEKLKETIPRQQFKIPLQASIGAKIIAREDIQAYRKDVTAKLYGGDYTRKMKLLEKQKKGKKRMTKFGKVEIPQEAFLATLKR